MLDCVIEAGVPQTMLGDSLRVQQILINLVGNSLKFTDNGEVRVHVSRLPHAPGGDVRLLFIVSDTGLGIPSDFMAELTQAFTQAEGNCGRNTGGVGLGLSIVSRLVRLMGGTMSVDSEPGKGTDIYVSLPFNTA